MKLIQFGDTINNIFTFTPYEEEDEMNISVLDNSIQKVGESGTFLPTGCGQGIIETPIYTKRFRLHNLDFKHNYNGSCDNKCCTSRSSFIAPLKRWMNRTLINGVRNMFAVDEEGTVYVAKGKVLSINYVNNQKDYIPAVSVTIKMVSPYWYDMGEREFFYFPDIPFEALVYPSSVAGFKAQKEITCTTKIMELNNCGCRGVILRYPTYYDEHPEVDPEDATCGGGVCDGDLVQNGNLSTCGSCDYCVDGVSASYVKIRIKGDWTNPTITNNTNGVSLNFNYALGVDDFVEFYFENKQCNTDNISIKHNLNIPESQIRNLLTLTPDVTTNELKSGCQDITVSGAGTNSYLKYTFRNRYL